jgi:hypothetical protein
MQPNGRGRTALWCIAGKAMSCRTGPLRAGRPLRGECTGLGEVRVWVRPLAGFYFLQNEKAHLLGAPLFLRVGKKLWLGVRIGGFAFAALFHLFGEFFTLLGAGVGTLLGLFV